MTWSTSSNDVLRSQEYLGWRSAKGICSTTGLCSKREASPTYGVDATVVKKDQVRGPHQLSQLGDDCDVFLVLGAARRVFEFLALGRRLVDKRTSSISHPVSSRKRTRTGR